MKMQKLDVKWHTVITADDLMVDSVVNGVYAYEQGMVKLIDNGMTQTAHGLMDYLDYDAAGKVVKIEGYEKLSLKLATFCKEVAERFKHSGPVTCHLFISPKGSNSFELHTDPDDVILHMVQGTKMLENPEHGFLITAGDTLRIPKNVEHRAVNLHSSLMLSIGLEGWITEKL